MKRIVLSLALLTGISLAETTDNLITDPYNQFLDGKYEYPNIHMHGDGSYDPYIYTGSSYYRDSAVAEHNINLDTLTFEITQVNYGYKYKSYSTGDGAIAIALLDANGDMIDDALHEFDITTVNQWINIDKIYNETDNLSQAKTILMGIAGSSDRNGTDDIMIGDIYLTYEYQEIPLDILTDPIIDIAFNDTLIKLEIPEATNTFEIKTDAINTEPTPSVSQPTQVNNTPTPQPTPQVAQQTTTTKTTTNSKENKKDGKKTSKTKEVKNEGQSKNAMRTVELVQTSSIPLSFAGSHSLFSGSNVGLEAFSGGIELVDSLQFTEIDFYKEEDFYENNFIPDSGILDNYKHSIYKDTNWYGSDIKFY